MCLVRIPSKRNDFRRCSLLDQLGYHSNTLSPSNFRHNAQPNVSFSRTNALITGISISFSGVLLASFTIAIAATPPALEDAFVVAQFAAWKRKSNCPFVKAGRST
jgi:hypothetical protein